MTSSYLECLIIIAAVSMYVFMVAEYEGSNLKVLNAGKTLIVLLMFFAGQLVSFGAGFEISTKVPLFIRFRDSSVYHNVVYVLAALILMIIGSYMIYRTLKTEEIEERLQEVNYKRIARESWTFAAFTCLSGMSSGFMKFKFSSSFITVLCATAAAVVLGLNSGYYQGYRFRRAVFGCSSAMLVGTGIEILVRYL